MHGIIQSKKLTEYSFLFISLIVLPAVLFLISAKSVFAQNTDSKTEAYEFAIPPSFDVVYPFSNGLAAVRINGKWGFIDQAGKIAIKPIYDEVHYKFSEGLVGVRLDDGKNRLWGFINTKGEVIVSPQYEEVIFFKEGLAAFRVGGGDELDSKSRRTGRMGYIDKNGNIAILPKFLRTYNFSEGLAVFKELPAAGDQTAAGFRYGYIDRAGKVAIKAIYKDAESFAEGLAAVQIKNSLGYINKKGTIVIPEIYSSVGKFNGGIAAVRKSSDSMFYEPTGYINKKGEYIIKPIFELGADFSDDRAIVTNESNVQGVIDKSGAIVIDYAFDEIYPYSGGYAVVTWGRDNYKKYGLIDKAGALVIPPTLDFSGMGTISEGLIGVQVKRNGIIKWGFIRLKTP